MGSGIDERGGPSYIAKRETLKISYSWEDWRQDNEDMEKFVYKGKETSFGTGAVLVGGLLGN